MHREIRRPFPVIVRRQHPAFLAHMCAILVRHIIQAFLAERRHPMCYHDITFHLANTEAAIP